MEALKQLVDSCPSGPALLASIEETETESTQLPKLIGEVLQQYSSKSNARRVSPGTETTGRSTTAALSVIDQTTFINPRGKHTIAFYDKDFVIQTNRGHIAVPYSAISHVLILDSLPKDTKDRVVLFMHLNGSAGILNGKTPLTSVVLQTTGSTQLTLRHPRTPGQKLHGPAAVVLCQLLGLLGVDPDSFSSPDASAFKSMAGHPGVEAHLKARQGTLFPLPTGLCFLESPAMFLPLAEIASMELARVGGTAATFDVYVHLKSGAVHEFAAISREEAGPMENYMHACKISSAPPESEEESGSEGQGDDEDEEEPAADSDDEDEDATFNPASSSDSQGGGEDEDEEDANSVEVVSEEGFTRTALDSLVSEEQTSKRQRKA